MLPPEHIKWFSNQPNATLSSTEIRKERHAVRYLDIGVDFDTTVFFLERFIGESLTKNLDKLQEPMVEETLRSVDEVLGTDESAWRTINVYNSMQDVITPAMSRVFFDLPLCRDTDFMTSFRRYILAMGVGTLVVGQMPRAFKRVLVPVFNLPVRYYRSKTMEVLVPMVEQQLQAQNLSATTAGSQEKYDLISQSARISAKLSGVCDVVNPGICRIVINDVKAYETLGEEAARSLQGEDDWMNPAVFKRLELCDSAIRETARYHPILIKGLTKEVVHPNGLSLPNGTHVPRGAWLGVPVIGLHRDDRFYPEALKYDPFRFARLNQDRRDLQRKTGVRGDQETTPLRDLDAARPTSTYVGFGYGKHACPGRWFAVQLLKILLAYITINYDIEAIGPRSEAKVIGDAALPPTSATIRVRRKKQTQSAK
ncbi:MAG: hypothetical protein Q9174_002918 [Haloplaca sp. 1 TL-2023]